MYSQAMEWLNYHHLYYFWMVAREGTIRAAGERLHLAQPTISAQLRQLETSLGHALFVKSGRTLALTEQGRVVFRYADEIFTLGNELLDTLKGRTPAGRLRFHIGVTDVLPKLVTYRLIKPAFDLKDPVHVVCYEGKKSELLTRLAVHDLDVVLSDSPIGSDVQVNAFNHLLGECDVTVLGSEALAKNYRRGFPHSLDGAPFILPTPSTMLRRSLDRWCDAENVRPHIVGEIEDSALLKVFGQAGRGLFVAPSVIEADIRRQYSVRRLGTLPEVKEQFYAISVERQVKHPATLAITQTARDKTLAD